MAVAKVFKSGNSQAVRLPKEFRLAASEVEIFRRGDEIVLRGDREARRFIVFWRRDGRVLAGMNVNVWDVTGPIQALIRSGAVVEARRLADEDVPLTDLATGVAA